MQLAYQAGKSSVSALDLLSKIENALRYKELASTAVIKGEGALNNTGVDSIKAAA
jgi:hypothetical protein